MVATIWWTHRPPRYSGRAVAFPTLGLVQTCTNVTPKEKAALSESRDGYRLTVLDREA